MTPLRCSSSFRGIQVLVLAARGTRVHLIFVRVWVERWFYPGAWTRDATSHSSCSFQLPERVGRMRVFKSKETALAWGAAFAAMVRAPQPTALFFAHIDLPVRGGGWLRRILPLCRMSFCCRLGSLSVCLSLSRSLPPCYPSPFHSPYSLDSLPALCRNQKQKRTMRAVRVREGVRSTTAEAWKVSNKLPPKHQLLTLSTTTATYSHVRGHGPCQRS